METEIWKSLPGVPGVEVSTFGKVRTLDRAVSSEKRTQFIKGRILKQFSDKDGYLRVSIADDGKRFSKFAHRLVAQTFIPNPDNLPEINHKDCNSANNNVDNLNWCTHQENIAYRDKLGHTARNNAQKSPVYAINLATLKVSHFRSQHEASRALGVFDSHINDVIKGKYKQAGGFWFVNDDDKATDAIKNKLHKICKGD